MVGHPQRDGRQARAREFAHGAIPMRRHDESERAGPETLCQLSRDTVELALPARGVDIHDMRDKRVERGAVLGGIKASHCERRGRVGTKPVDRLRRERDEAAPLAAAPPPDAGPEAYQADALSL